MCLVVLEISITKTDWLDNFNIQKFVVKKEKNQHVLKGHTDFMDNAYRVAALSKLYLTVIWNHHAKFEIDRAILTCQK